MKIAQRHSPSIKAAIEKLKPIESFH